VKRWLRRRLLLLGFSGAFLTGCGGAQPVVKDASCSPNADAWFGAELVKVCKGMALSECPEADSIGEDYELRAAKECE
jgi:hypothetical protein